MIKEKAIAKLKGELGKAKSFESLILDYLIKRCEEDNGLCEDVCQEHKTWAKCIAYIYKEAKNTANGASQCAVEDIAVYEWAEDYYHKDDKAEEEEKAKKEAERKQKEAERKAEKEVEKTVPKTKPVEVKEEPKPKKNNKDMEGQMDLFSLMGM